MKTLLPYIYDFLSLLLEEEKAKSMIKRVILFGSAARDDADQESDVDLFIDVWSRVHEKETEAYVKEADKRFYLVSEKKWSLMGVRNPIKCIVGKLDDDKWKDLRLEISSYGIVIFGKYEEEDEKSRQFAIFSYSLSKLDQKKKMRFLRNLFGYKTTKGKKKYIQPGILKAMIGEKIGPNAILVPVERSKEVREFMNSFGITPLIRTVRTRQQ
jgi:predicted nucleotidyltransferase